MCIRVPSAERKLSITFILLEVLNGEIEQNNSYSFKN